MAKIFSNWWKNTQGLNWGQGAEVTKIGAEAAEAVFDLAKAINEQKPKAEDLKPYIAQISSLLDVINAPLGQIAGSVIPFAPIAITTLKLIVDATKKEPSLESCVILVSQVAYVESLQAILQEDSQLQQQINQESAVSETLARQIKKLGVTLDPDNKRYQDSRGLAKVLTGDLVGALEDFRAAVDSGEFDFSEDVKQRRLRWIKALELGNNPLTPEELEELRQAEG
jgi:hypothetical protein